MSEFVCEADGCSQPAQCEWRRFDYDPYDGYDTYYTLRCLAHVPDDPDYQLAVLDDDEE
jgi:hypothetical protein